MRLYVHTQEVPPGPLIALGALGTMASLAAPGKMKLFGGLCVAGLMSTFRSLTVIVDEREIVLKFGDWLEAKRVPLVSIKRCAPTRTSPLSGWGIRFIGTGWLYNIYGLDAVEVELLDGTRVFIGRSE